MTDRRSETTEKLLRAARAQFAALGFERTTVRSVAAEAGVDPALVIRYFGGKDGLFAEAAAVDLKLPDLRHVPRQEIGQAVVKHFLHRWEDEDGHDILRVLMRSAATNPSAAAQMRAIFADQVARMVASVVPEREARTRAGLIATQVLGLAFVRNVVRLPEPALDIDALARTIGPTIERYLFEPIG